MKIIFIKINYIITKYKNMKIENLENLINLKTSIKNIIKNIIITQAIEFNQQLLNILNTFPNLKLLELNTTNSYDYIHNDLINELCNSNIGEIKIKFNNFVWFCKASKAYDYQNTRIKRIWNTLKIHDRGHTNYDNLPNEINYLFITSKTELNIRNLPINLLKIDIRSQFINPVFGYKKWKIPFGCEVYFNDRIIDFDK
jgi:hypothetical protein